jgi:hypothetical protein
MILSASITPGDLSMLLAGLVMDRSNRLAGFKSSRSHHIQGAGYFCVSLISSRFLVE